MRASRCESAPRSPDRPAIRHRRWLRLCVAAAAVWCLAAAACAGGENAEFQAAVGADADSDAATNISAPPAGTEAADDGADTAEVVDCPDHLASAGLECFLVTVPISRQLPLGTTRISVTVHPGTPGAAVMPVAWLGDMPGEAASLLAPYMGHQDHSVIYIDQRGTGYSPSDWSCGTPEQPVDVFDGDGLDLCARMLRADPTFPFADAETAAADAHDAMAALGYSQWVAYGAGHAAAAVLAALRQDPAPLRGVILDGPIPAATDVNALMDQAHDAAVSELSRSCGDDPDCAALLASAAGRPVTLTDLLAETIERLRQQPLAAAAADGGGEVVIDGAAAARLVSVLLLVGRGYAHIPKLVAGLAARDAETAQVAAEWLATFAAADAQRSRVGARLTVVCSDWAPFAQPPPAGGVFAAATAEGAVQGCESWPAQPSQNVAPTQTSPVPAVVFYGALDPYSPPAAAMAAADLLTNSVLVAFGTQSHPVVLYSQCARSIISGFLAASIAVDVACADQGAQIAW